MRFLSCLTFVLLLVGCATPYQERKVNGGYYDFEVKPGVHFVSFRGSRFTGKDDVIEFWHRRAYEICPGYEIMEKESGQLTKNLGLPFIFLTYTTYSPYVEGYITCPE